MIVNRSRLANLLLLRENNQVRDQREREDDAEADGKLARHGKVVEEPHRLRPIDIAGIGRVDGQIMVVLQCEGSMLRIVATGSSASDRPTVIRKTIKNLCSVDTAQQV